MSETELTILKLLIGGFFGSLATAVITIWRTRYTVKSSDFSKRVTDVNEKIDLISQCACRIWSGSEHSDSILHNKHYLVGLVAALKETISAMDTSYNGFSAESIKEPLFEFTDACTGDEFSSSGTVEEHRVRKILKYAEHLKNEMYKTRLSKY